MGDKKATVGDILRELSSLLADSGRDFALYTLLVGGFTATGILAGLTDTVSSLDYGGGTLDYGFAMSSTDSLESSLFDLAATIVSVFGTYLLLTRFLAARGRLRTGAGRFWHYLGMGILSAIAVVVGLILFIVPGIFLLVRWSASSGFVIGARESVTGSLGASWRATEGHGWAIFLSAVILLVGFALGSGALGAATAFASAQIAGVVSAFVEAAFGGVFAAFGIAIYCLVHDDAREISEVFA